MIGRDTAGVWDLVKVPFPYTDRGTRQHRPALVIAVGHTDGQPTLLWVLMVTSAAHRPWGDDVAISDLEVAGLPAPSVVRCSKVATIERRDAAPLGVLPDADRAGVLAYLQRIVAGLSPPSGT